MNCKMAFLVMLFLYFANSIQAQCTSCSITISTNSSSAITIDGDNQKVCIIGGTYTGTITLNGSGNSICIDSAGTIDVGASLELNGSDITVDNEGTVNLTNLTLIDNATYNNRGNTNISNSLTLSSNSTYNQISSTTTVSNQIIIDVSASLLVSGGAFQQTNPSVSNNANGTISISNNATFEIAGNLTNNGTLNISDSRLNIGGSFTNNSSGTVNLNGILEVTGNAINNGLIQVSGSSCSQLSVNNLTNNASGVISGTSTANIDICNTGTFTNFGTSNNIEPIPCNCNVQLAIHLLEFSVSLAPDNQNIVLKWIATSDEAEDVFYIEKSTDGLRFSELALMPAIQSPEPYLYTFNDNEISNNGDVYYRLRLEEGNGKISYSKIKAINITHQRAEYIIFPNPAIDKIHIRLINVENQEEILVNIYDALGQKIESSLISSKKDNEISLEKLPKGIYFVECLDLSGKNVFEHKREKIILTN